MSPVGAALPSGSGSWSNLSDRAAKANFQSIDPASLLEKLAAMPVWNWNYKTQADSVRHLGLTAQDFHKAFGLGEDDKHISTVDAEGVALAGIQGLYSELKHSLAEKDREISDLRARLAQLERSAGRR
jgi:trimeric autotransporter adhesin